MTTGVRGGPRAFGSAPDMVQNTSPEDKVNEELHIANYQRLAMKYPGAYREFRRSVGFDSYLYFLLALLDQVPQEEQEEAMLLLSSTLSSINMEEMRKKETAAPKKVPELHEIELPVERQESPIAGVLQSLGFTLFIYRSQYSHPTNLPDLSAFGKRLIALIIEAKRIAENTLEGDFLEILKGLSDATWRDNASDVVALANDSIEILQGNRCERNFIEILGRLRRQSQTDNAHVFAQSIKIAKYFASAFPEEAPSLLDAVYYRSDVGLEVLELYKRQILELLKISPKNMKSSTLKCIAQNRDLISEELFERISQSSKEMGFENGLLNSIVLNIPIEESTLKNIAMVIKKYKLLTVTSSRFQIERLLKSLSRIPEEELHGMVELALTLRDPQEIFYILDYLHEERAVKNIKLMSKYQLRAERSIDPLLMAMSHRDNPEDDILMVLPLLNIYPAAARGTLFFFCYTTDIFKVSQEKAKAVVNYLHTSASSTLPMNLIKSIVHLLKDDNLEKAQQASQATLKSLEDHKLAKLLEENL